MGKWTRRAVIGAGSLVGGGLVLGVGGALLAPNRLRIRPEDTAGTSQLTTWIRLTPDNVVTAVIPHCEMGQGATLGLAMMLADELDADWQRVQIEEAPPEDAYANGYTLRGFAAESGMPVPDWLERAIDYASYKVADLGGLQLTGGSTSTRATGEYGMRVAGASARVMLLEAAAAELGVPVAELTAKDSVITHAATGRQLTYGALASAAAALELPEAPVLKRPEGFVLIGTAQPRPDIPRKVDGSEQYGIDVSLPGLLVAAIAQAPVPGGTLEGFNEQAALALPKVHAVVPLGEALAVVAEGYWYATRALAAASPRFTDAGLGGVDSALINARHAAAIRELPRVNDDARATAADFVRASYRVPYLAHAPLEPMAATVRLADGRCEVWAGTQDPLYARRTVATAAGLDPAQVTMHNLHSGGSFGRRLPGAFDYIEQAVAIAQAVSPRPVKLIWSREEDMQHDYYRDVVHAELSATLDRGGQITSWGGRFTGSPFMDAMAATPFYSVGAADIEIAEPPAHLRTGSWRSVAWSQHVFFMESFMDELAARSGQDPLTFRHAQLAEKPRHRAVLEHVANLSRWQSPLPEGQAKGLALAECFGSIIAVVAVVSGSPSAGIRVHRIDAAVDCGYAVNPDQARAQVEGGIIFGLSAALEQKITVRNGAVVERSFPDYPMVRLANAPRIRVGLMNSGAELGGMGEPGVPPVAPAVANALFALTGDRYRSLPLIAG